jgi:hypothetical protein
VIEVVVGTEEVELVVGFASQNAIEHLEVTLQLAPQELILEYK